MGTPIFLVAARRVVSWSTFVERLRRGEPDAYFILIAVALGIAVALWAGSNMMRKEKR